MVVRLFTSFLPSMIASYFRNVARTDAIRMVSYGEDAPSRPGHAYTRAFCRNLRDSVHEHPARRLYVSARAAAGAVRGRSRGGAQADQDCGSSRRRDDGVRPATAAGEHLQDLMTNAANTRSMQKEDDMDMDVS
jgi:hypothetical protein